MRTICLFFSLFVMSGCAGAPPPTADSAAPCTENCFDPVAATHALDRAIVDAQKCAASDSEKSGSAQITFEPSGTVSNVVLDAHLARSEMASCIEKAFQKSEVPAFNGEPQTVGKVFSIGGVQEVDR